jgi:hypothetical protein
MGTGYGMYDTPINLTGDTSTKYLAHFSYILQYLRQSYMIFVRIRIRLPKRYRKGTPHFCPPILGPNPHPVE